MHAAASMRRRYCAEVWYDMRTAPVGGVAVTLMCPVCQAGLVFAVVLCFFLKEAVSDDRMRNESFLL